MHAGIPEIDVHEIRIAPEEDAPDKIKFAAVDDCGRAGKIFQPGTFERVDAWFVEELNIRKRITIDVFAKPGNDKRVGPAQRSDLSIDVEHLCLQKIGAETSDESAEVCGGHGGRIITTEAQRTQSLRKEYRKGVQMTKEYIKGQTTSAEHPTPNTKRRTPNAERRTPNAERRTPNAERQTLKPVSAFAVNFFYDLKRFLAFLQARD